MNGETQNEAVTQRVWQIAFGVAYVALFFLPFVVQPAPEQRMRASIGIMTSRDEVSRLLNHSTPIRTLQADRVGEYHPWLVSRNRELKSSPFGHKLFA